MTSYYSLREHIARPILVIAVKLVTIAVTVAITPFILSFVGLPSAIGYIGWAGMGLGLAVVATISSTYLEYLAIRDDSGREDDLILQRRDGTG